ncbi:MAG: DUF262 domain-containing protein [Acidimicrobiia bacterium]
MEIKQVDVTVRELTDGYKDKNEDGVVAYGGRLDVRPPYQRECVYNDKQRKAVIHTATNDYPLNVMYWAVRDNGGFEIIDGQQRTISLCQYVSGEFAFDDRYFHNLQDDEKQQILDYELTIYQCKGEDSDKLRWFETINIAGAVHTDQELRNAAYHGSWVTDAKRYFSKTSGPAYALASAYMTGTPIRQTYLETAISWISHGDIKDYMAQHQHDPDAKKLWEYFRQVIAWVEATFTNKRSEMKGLDWGGLYGKYGQAKLNADQLEGEIAKLMMDDDVLRKKGIYPYVLTRDQRHLHIRAFTKAQKRSAYERQKGICPFKGDPPHVNGDHFAFEEMEADHITPWHEGGKTVPENCQMLCREHNRRKGGR